MEFWLLGLRKFKALMYQFDCQIQTVVKFKFVPPWKNISVYPSARL